MSIATPEVFLIREEPIQRLEKILGALSQAVDQSGLEKGKGIPALREAIACRCLRCGVFVEGEELLKLPELPAKSESRSLKRLRQGHCVSENCKSTEYDLILKKHPDLDWPKLLLPPESDEERKTKREAAEAAEVQAAHRAKLKRSLCLGSLIILGLLLLLLRQYFVGGRIPLIREPEKFRVDPGPDFPGAR